MSHEEHFGQVTARFLEYLKDGKLPGMGSAGDDNKVLYNYECVEESKRIREGVTV